MKLQRTSNAILCLALAGVALNIGTAHAGSALQQAAHQRTQQVLASLHAAKSTADYTAANVNRIFHTRVIADDEGFSRGIMLDSTWWMAISVTGESTQKQVMFLFGKNGEKTRPMPFCAITIADLTDQFTKWGMSHDVMLRGQSRRAARSTVPTQRAAES